MGEKPERGSERGPRLGRQALPCGLADAAALRLLIVQEVWP